MKEDLRLAQGFRPNIRYGRRVIPQKQRGHFALTTGPGLTNGEIDTKVVILAAQSILKKGLTRNIRGRI